MKRCPSCQTQVTEGAEFCPHDGMRLRPDDDHGTAEQYDALIGEVVEGRYKVEARIGEGGLAQVYAASHLAIQKRVALKVLRTDFLRDLEVVERFLREAKVASRLGHPGIVAVTDFGRTGRGAPFLVMDLVDGRPLSRVLAEARVLPVHRAVDIALQIGRALAFAHGQGVIHRDLKPENVMIVSTPEAEATVRLLDFGLAKIVADRTGLTRAGQILGSPDCLSPEQATGRPVDHRTDVYALGALLYRMITGAPPFSAPTVVALIDLLLHEAPRPLAALRDDPAVTPALTAAIDRAMAREPVDRFNSMDAMVQALEAARPGAAPAAGARRAGEARAAPPPSDRGAPPAAASAPTATARLQPREDPTEMRLARSLVGRSGVIRARRRRLTLWLVVAVVGALLGAGAAYLALGRRETGRGAPPPPPAPAAGVPAPGGGVDVRRVESPPVRPGAPARLTLRSVPSGATVTVDARPAGPTPVFRSQPAESRQVEVVFTLPGHRPAVRQVWLDRDTDVEVALQPIPAPPRSGNGATGPMSPPERGMSPSLGDLKDPFGASSP